MLKPEEAKEQLKKFHSPEFVGERISHLTKLPAALRSDARILFNLEETKPLGTQQYYLAMLERRQKKVDAYRSLGEKNIQRLMETMLPGLAPYILKALADIGRLPYTSGHGRKPFRSTTIPQLLDRPKTDFLITILNSVAEYPPDIEWIAAWAPHAWPHLYKPIGQILAAAVDMGDAKGRAVFDILLSSARGEHETGQMGGHVVAALLIAEKVEGWEFIEKLLLAAQREEGLRQTILEFIDEAHPLVFPRFLRVILEHDLVRFSAMVRAVDVWFGFMWDAMSAGKAKQILEHALRFSDDPAAADSAIARARELPQISAQPRGKKLVEADEAVEPAYIALWTKAFSDAASSFEPAELLLQSANSDVRFVATHFLGQLQLVGRVSKSIASRLADPDDRVACRALFHFGPRVAAEQKQQAKAVPDLFERLEALVDRTPAKSIKLAPIVWPWMSLPWGKEVAAGAMLNALGDRSATRLLPHVENFGAGGRMALIRSLPKTRNGTRAPVTRSSLWPAMQAARFARPPLSIYKSAGLTRPKRSGWNRCSHARHRTCAEPSSRYCSSNRTRTRLAAPIV